MFIENAAIACALARLWSYTGDARAVNNFAYVSVSDGVGVGIVVSGEVLRIEGENYVVKDAMGKEVKLHVSPETKKDGDIKVGDKIEAQADATGHALSIKAAKAAK